MKNTLLVTLLSVCLASFGQAATITYNQTVTLDPADLSGGVFNQDFSGNTQFSVQAGDVITGVIDFSAPVAVQKDAGNLPYYVEIAFFPTSGFAGTNFDQTVQVLGLTGTLGSSNPTPVENSSGNGVISAGICCVGVTATDYTLTGLSYTIDVLSVTDVGNNQISAPFSFGAVEMDASSITIDSTPEPASAFLIGAGLIALGLSRRRRTKGRFGGPFGSSSSRSLKLIPAICMFWLLQSSAYAAPVKWTINVCSGDPLCGFAGNDSQGIISGSFVFDADTGLYSSVDIVVGALPSNDFPETTYTVPDYSLGITCGGSEYCQTVLIAVPSELPDLTGAPYIDLAFGSALGDAGGLSDIYGALQGYCTNSNCSTLRGVVGDGGYNNFGTVTSSVPSSVPEPATFGMIAAGLVALMAGLRLGRSRTASPCKAWQVA